MTLYDMPESRDFARIRHLPVPAYNPLNIMDTSIKLAQPCEKCGAASGVPCGKECHKPMPLGPSEIRVMPGDSFDPNPDQHPEPAPANLIRRYPL